MTPMHEWQPAIILPNSGVIHCPSGTLPLNRDGLTGKVILVRPIDDDDAEGGWVCGASIFVEMHHKHNAELGIPWGTLILCEHMIATD